MGYGILFNFVKIPKICKTTGLTAHDYTKIVANHTKNEIVLFLISLGLNIPTYNWLGLNLD